MVKRGVILFFAIFLIYSVSAISVSTSDGLSIDFNNDGTINYVQSDGNNIGLSSRVGGLYVKEMGPGEGFTGTNIGIYEGVLVNGGTVTKNGNVLTHSVNDATLQMQINTTYTEFSNYIKVDVNLEDLTNSDRALLVYYRLPIDAQGWTWYDGIYDSDKQIISGTGSFDDYAEFSNGAYRPVANNFYLNTISSASENVGLTLAVPLNVPRIFRTRYQQAYGFQTEFELGVSPDTLKFPDSANFTFIIYKQDPTWGIRKAFEKYYSIYPEFFSYSGEPGSWYQLYEDMDISGNLEALVSDPTSLGLRWKLDALWESDATRNNDIYVCKYIEPWADHIEFEQSEILALTEDIPANHFTPEVSKGWDAVEMARTQNISGIFDTATTDQWSRRLNGEHYIYFQNPDLDLTKNIGGQWWLSRGNLSIEYEFYRQLGALPSGPNDVYGGLNYDSTAVWWTRWDAYNHRRDHFYVADYPLVFDHRTSDVALTQTLSNLEFMKASSEIMKNDNKKQIGNTDFGYYYPYKFVIPYLDMLGAENDFSEDYINTGRIMASKKPMSFLYYHWDNQAFVEDGLRLGIYPGGGGADTSATDAAAYNANRDYIAHYVTILDAINHAGYEPVTYATSSNSNILVERFGNDSTNLFFTLHNPTTSVQSGTISFDFSSLGSVPTSAEVNEMVDENSLSYTYSDQTGILDVSLTLGASRTYVFNVTSSGSSDVNSDGDINVIDLAIEIFNQGRSLPDVDYNHLDINQDGMVNWADVWEIIIRI